MFTFDLHKKLRAYNEVSTQDIQEQLILKEAEKILENAKADDYAILSRLGLNKNLTQASSIKAKIANEKRFTEVYDISVIKKLAVNYRLRFLPSFMYKGEIDPVLPQKIREFISEHNIQEKDPRAEHDFFGNRSKSDYYILAPASSFELQKRPKDPILFYKISDDKFAVIHKWGNDLSVFRYFKYFLYRSHKHLYISVFVLTLILCSILPIPKFVIPFIAVASCLVTTLFGLLFQIIRMDQGKEEFEFSSSNWNSEYK